MRRDKSKKAETQGRGAMGAAKRHRPRLGLLTSFFPRLTARIDSQSSSELHRKPVPGSSAAAAPSDSPTSTAPSMTMTTATARTSEDSKSSSRFDPGTASGTASSSLSPVDQMMPPPHFDAGITGIPGIAEPTARPKKLHKAPAAPSSSPPLPPQQPPTLLTKLNSPPRIPAVTATQATPPGNRRAARRSPSPEGPASRAQLQPNHLHPRHASPVSNPLHTRAHSKPGSEGSPPASADKRKSRMSWFPVGGGGGSRSRAGSDVVDLPRGPGAWVMAEGGTLDYSTAALVNGEKVPELWNESGNVLVYVHPKGSGRGPCFKVPEHVFSPSSKLVELLVTEMMANAGMPSQDAAGYLDVAPVATGPVTEGHLYLPLGNTDLERLVAARNLFAFLTHQPLVGTPQHATAFAVILQVAGLLRRFNFSSFDGTSFGDSVDAAFDFFLDQTGLADVRHSREKTLEALILAEQMKSWNLYSEAFPHAVGKYETLLELKSPLYDRISVSTRQRMDRAHLDLANRQANVNTRLEAFEFPSLFAGTASSTSSDEYRGVRFKEWRNSFARTRSFALGYYKGLFGNWPPRARSKKNYFSQSGLNRQCLRILYSDFCALYDLLVDRTSLTPRVIGEAFQEEQQDEDSSKDKDAAKNNNNNNNNNSEASISALRKVLGEFDKSSPPVLPPVPFDVPKLPSMTALYENYADLPAKKQAKYAKSLQPHELQLLLLKSRNLDADALQTPFLAAYKEFELREARGAAPADLVDQRIGAWLFLYVVLQSLPMLVVDAPGLRHTEGVEDFLCEAPQGNAPWTDDAGVARKMWYRTGGDTVVELSADVVMFSVEGIYMRSHCWLAAKEWDITTASPQQPPSSPPFGGTVPPTTTAPAEFTGTDATSPLQPPRPVFHTLDPSLPAHRSSSPGAGSSPSSSPHLRPRSGSTNDRARQAFRASIAIGLEPLPMPMAPMGVDRRSRVLSVGSWAMSGSSSEGMGFAPGDGEAGGYFAPSGQGQGQFQQGGGLRTSRSAVNLGYASPLPLPHAMPEFVGQQQQQQHPMVRNSSYGGGFPGGGFVGGGGFGPGPSGFGPGSESSASLTTATVTAGGGAVAQGQGPSTFDDILKGMDGKGKKKKKLFF
ncbi:hypothetical protein C8A05DRAFT_29309 [Staphylotrichum tortipilum]|uniref:DUF8004 domain-containing protein n=1 Tax=Staphylotrichum tortipilum TaxID=2831512 RepID=A0AAN6MUC2_9PEZI|nr:hypothetical protein C8A05DRAFT_29309 [Staphylotrichum longicolle]